MFVLETTIRAIGDETFQIAQAIALYPYRKLLRKPELVSEFLTLVLGNFTFVDDWTSEKITLSTYRLYGKRFPSKEPKKKFINRVCKSIRE